MSKKGFFTLFFILWFGAVGELHAQKSATFNSLEEALRNPDKVRVLNLGGQKLETLPADIGKFKNLRKLILQGNKLTALPAEIAQLTQLQELDLYNNKLKDIPLSVASLHTLKRLDVGKNRLREIPASVLALDSLEKLYAYSNRIKRLTPDITRLKRLKELRLGGGLRFFWNGNKIKSLPANIGELKELEELHLPDNQLRSLPASFINLKKLRYLELLHNRFKQVPAEVLALDSVRYVSIWDRHFGDKHKADVATRLPRTRVLYEPKFEGNFTALYLGMMQGKYTTAHLGIARAFKKDFVLVGMGLLGGYQFQPQAYTARAGVWINFLPTVGLSVVHYGKLGKERQYATGFAPEIGVGKGMWRVFYSYTWAWGSFRDFNRHAVQAQCLVRF